MDTRSPGLWPSTSMGKAALIVTGAAIAAAVVMPVLTVTLRSTVPIVDTWVMPALLGALVDLAAVLGVLAVWRQKEAATMSVIALVITGAIGGFITASLVMGGLFGI